MTPQEINRVLELVKKHEGWRKRAYDDATALTINAPEGKLTIGYGFNIQDMGLPEIVADFWLKYELEEWVIPSLQRAFLNFDRLSIIRKAALISMMYNLGEPRFKGFINMIAAINSSDWLEACKQALDSKWARQVKSRADEIADMLLVG